MSDIMVLVTDRDPGEKEFHQAGESVQNLERSFNVLHAGFGRSDDMPPLKFVDIPVNKGVYTGEKIALAKWNQMLDEYYQHYGWDIETGWPTKKRLLGLGLDTVVEKLQKNGITLP